MGNVGAVEKDTVGENQFFIGRKQNEKWKQWISTEDFYAKDEISVHHSDKEQYWRLEFNESDFTWSFYVIRSGKKLYVSYDDTDKVTMEQDGQKERYFKVSLQVDGRFLIKASTKVSDEDMILSIGSNGKLALLRGEVDVQSNEWFILKYFEDADETVWYRVSIGDSNSPYQWRSTDVHQNDQIPLSTGQTWVWWVKPLHDHKMFICNKSELYVVQQESSDIILLDRDTEVLKSSGREKFLVKESPNTAGALLIQSPVNPDLWLSADDDNKYVVLKDESNATAWDTPPLSITYWHKGHVKYYPPIKNED